MVRRLQWSLFGAILTVSQFACMQSGGNAPSRDASTNVGVATTAIVPTADGTQPAGGLAPASSPNSSNQNQAIAPGNLQGAQASMTIASNDVTDLCLTLLSDANQTTLSLVLRSCTASLTQRWVLVSGMLQSAQGSCLTLTMGSNGPVPAMQVCNSKDPNQQVLVQGAKITIGTATTSYALGTVSVPTTASVVQFVPTNPASPALQAWQFGQYSHTDSGAAVVNGTPLVALEQSPTGCLGQNSATNQLLFATCSAADPTQSWTFVPPGTLVNSGTCLDSSVTPPAMTRCTGATSQLWSFNNGLLVSNGNCLTATAASGGNTTISVGGCDFLAGSHFVLGLSL